MKFRIVVTIIISLFSFQVMLGQFVDIHVHVNSRDSKTRKVLGEIMSHTTLRLIQLVIQNEQLRKSKANYKELLERSYKKTKTDDENDFIKKALISSTINAIPASVVNLYKLPYMTKNKIIYINTSASEKILLASIANIDEKTNKVSHRQEIYRLRNELLKAYSKNDKAARKLLLLPAAATAIKNKKELLTFLKSVELLF